MLALVAAGALIVSGARGVAAAFGIDEFIVGATLVAIGTSTPELATTIIAKWRGHDEVGLGTIIGSNIFNNLFIVAVAAMIHPISVAWREVAVALGFGIVALAFCYPPRDGVIGRGRGLLLLALYVAYNATLFQ
jgi:cation:H+ antiporter